MSSEARPISPTRFAEAVRDLPLENLYTKVAEIQNSIAHLERSNAELESFLQSEGQDPDLLAAIRENKDVISSMNQRISLLKVEVERRGQRWNEGGRPPATNGEAKTGGSLNDDELRRQLEQTMGDEDEDGGDGVHL